MNETTITAEPNTLFVTIEREFDAPVEEVFRAFVDPALVSQWLGPRGYTMETPIWDARTGGAYALRIRTSRARNTNSEVRSIRWKRLDPSCRHSSSSGIREQSIWSR